LHDLQLKHFGGYMSNIRYSVIVLAAINCVVLGSCSTAPHEFSTRAGDTCQAQRRELESVEEYFNQSLVEGTALGVFTGALTGAAIGYASNGTKGAVIGAVGGAAAGGAGGYFIARSQAIQDRNSLVRTVYDEASKENIQVNRATAAFASLRDCRYTSAQAIRDSYRQGTMSQAEAEKQLAYQRELFDEEVAYAEKIGAHMKTRNANFLSAAVELEKTDPQPVIVENTPPPKKKAATKSKATAAKAPPAKPVAPPNSTAGVKAVAESNQDGVQAFASNIELAKADRASKFNLAV